MEIDTTIVAGVIGALATLIATVISPIMSRRKIKSRRGRFILQLPRNRQEALIGMWSGEMYQTVGLPIVCNEHKIQMSFLGESEALEGNLRLDFKFTGDVTVDRDNYVDAKLVNTIFDGTIFKSDYVNKDSNATNFGTIYGKLSASGKTINGEFLSYGLVSQKFVSGTFNIERSA